MGVSTLYKEDEHIEDCDKTFFDWIKENNTEKVASLLQIEKTEVNTKDAEVRVFTTRQRSYGKAMFSVVPVCPQRKGRGAM